jgi:hypothetical protein
MYCLRYLTSVGKSRQNRMMAAQPPGKRPAEQSIFVHASHMTLKLLPHPCGIFSILSSPRQKKSCIPEVQLQNGSSIQSACGNILETNHGRSFQPHLEKLKYSHAASTAIESDLEAHVPAYEVYHVSSTGRLRVSDFGVTTLKSHI